METIIKRSETKSLTQKRLFSLLDKSLPSIFEDINEVGADFFIAGGAITSIFTNATINDWDIYPKSKRDLLELLNYVSGKSQLISYTDKSALFLRNGKELINIIYLDTYETATKIFDSFDFNVVKGAYDFRGDAFILHEDFMLGVAKKELNYSDTTKFPIVTLRRVEKYKSRGYTISNSDYSAIMLRIASLDLKTWEDLDSHIGGMYGSNFSKRFKDIEFSINKAIELLLEHNIEKDTPASDSDMKKSLNGKVLELTEVVCKQEILPKLLSKSWYTWKDNLVYEDNGVFKLTNVKDLLPSTADVPMLEFCKSRIKTLTNPIPEDAVITLYKNITVKDDGRIVSTRINSFEYKLNTLVTDPTNHGLYFSSCVANLRSATYNEAKHYIKCLVNLSDIKSVSSSSIVVTSCIPIELVTKRDSEINFDW